MTTGNPDRLVPGSDAPAPSPQDARVRASASESVGGDPGVRASASEPVGGDPGVRASASEPVGGDLGEAFIDEAVDAVAVVFASVEPTRDDLVTHALRNRTRPPIIAALQALPNRRYRNVRQVRNDLLRQQR